MCPFEHFVQFNLFIIIIIILVLGTICTYCFFFSYYTLGGFINRLCSCSIEVSYIIYLRTGIANGPFLRINSF